MKKEKLMKKEMRNKFNRNYYLLGTRKEDNKKVWLEEGHFDCNWYYGIGYIEIFNRRYTDIEEHTHFDSLFLKKDIYNSFKDYFETTTLTNDEIWKLLENMETLYSMRTYSDMLYAGSSHITNNTNNELIKNNDEYDRINKILIPKILNDTYKLLSE